MHFMPQIKVLMTGIALQRTCIPCHKINAGTVLNIIGRSTNSGYSEQQGITNDPMKQPVGTGLSAR